MRTVLLHEGVEYRPYDDLYAASEDGRFLMMKCMRLVQPGKRWDGYLTVGRQRLAHRMVAVCWLKKPVGARHVHHIDHDKTNNRATNLEWLTPKQYIDEGAPPECTHSPCDVAGGFRPVVL